MTSQILSAFNFNSLQKLLIW